MYPIGSVTVRSASANRKAFTYNENNKKHDNNKKGDVFMNKKMRLWVAGTVGVLMTGLMSVNAYALEEKDVIGTWYVNELSMGGDILFHPGVMGMEVTVDIKEGGQMETITSYSGEEPEADQSEWKIENDKLLMTFVSDFKSSNAYKESFNKSVELAKLRNVPENERIKSKADIDCYFRGGSLK